MLSVEPNYTSKCLHDHKLPTSHPTMRLVVTSVAALDYALCGQSANHLQLLAILLSDPVKPTVKDLPGYKCGSFIKRPLPNHHYSSVGAQRSSWQPNCTAFLGSCEHRR
eukprot:TRINITY_DN25261_c0_g1_i1.p1 TRINITY_DN25261_c0_g1~~TRINITY_DN25261_c0_g1_i1.p1  ORF type:complete len:109 (+),score=0.27 TRINITY_DN25261_c0_g1_i1:711-1037(+)